MPAFFIRFRPIFCFSGRKKEREKERKRDRARWMNNFCFIFPLIICCCCLLFAVETLGSDGFSNALSWFIGLCERCRCNKRKLRVSTKRELYENSFFHSYPQFIHYVSRIQLRWWTEKSMHLPSGWFRWINHHLLKLRKVNLSLDYHFVWAQKRCRLKRLLDLLMQLEEVWRFI